MGSIERQSPQIDAVNLILPRLESKAVLSKKDLKTIKELMTNLSSSLPHEVDSSKLQELADRVQKITAWHKLPLLEKIYFIFSRFTTSLVKDIQEHGSLLQARADITKQNSMDSAGATRIKKYLVGQYTSNNLNIEQMRSFLGSCSSRGLLSLLQVLEKDKTSDNIETIRKEVRLAFLKKAETQTDNSVEGVFKSIADPKEKVGLVLDLAEQSLPLAKKMIAMLSEEEKNSLVRKVISKTAISEQENKVLDCIIIQRMFSLPSLNSSLYSTLTEAGKKEFSENCKSQGKDSWISQIQPIPLTEFQKIATLRNQFST